MEVAFQAGGWQFARRARRIDASSEFNSRSVQQRARLYGVASWCAWAEARQRQRRQYTLGRCVARFGAIPGFSRAKHRRFHRAVFHRSSRRAVPLRKTVVRSRWCEVKICRATFDFRSAIASVDYARQLQRTARTGGKIRTGCFARPKSRPVLVRSSFASRSHRSFYHRLLNLVSCASGKSRAKNRRCEAVASSFFHFFNVFIYISFFFRHWFVTFAGFTIVD